MTGLNAKLIVRLYELIRDGQFEVAGEIQVQIQRFYQECLLEILQTEGLQDSGIDRVMRVAGKGPVGLQCQRPYRSARQEHVERLIGWCRENAPILLPENSD